MSRCQRYYLHRLASSALLMTVVACLLGMSNFISTLSMLRIRKVASTDRRGEAQVQVVGGGSNAAGTETLEDRGGASSASSHFLPSKQMYYHQKNMKWERPGAHDRGQPTVPKVNWWQSLKMDGGAVASGTATAHSSNGSGGTGGGDGDDDKDGDDDDHSDDDRSYASGDDIIALRPPSPPPPPDLTGGAEVPPQIIIAYVITLSRCDPNDRIQDGAAVLAHSIRRHSRPPPTAGGDASGGRGSGRSRYGAKFYAILHPKASTCANKLSRLGYEVLIRSPVGAVETAESDQMSVRQRFSGLNGNGTKWSGEERPGREHVKLHAFTLVEHPLAVLLDVASIVLRPLDELFDAMLLPPRGKEGGGNETVIREEGGVVQVAPAGMRGKRSKVVWEREYIDGFVTADDNLDTEEMDLLNEDGLVVIRPSMDEFFAMRSGVESGVYDRIDWGGLHVLQGTSPGDERSSGTAIESSSTLKGLLSRHYRVKNGGGKGSNVVELNRCVYNVASDVFPVRNNSTACDENEAEEDCLATGCRSIVKRFRATMRSFTFSAGVCHKPWRCSGHEVRHSLRDPSVTELSLCQQMTHAWFRFRQELEDIWTQNLGDISDNGRYVYSPPYRLGTYEPYEFLGNCIEQGSEGYVMMQLP